VSNSPPGAGQPPTAADICARISLKKDARDLLREGMTPGAFLAALIANRKYVAAIEFLAQALPPRTAIWWGCLCLQHVYGHVVPRAEYAALQAATVWVVWPQEPYRAAAQAQGKAAGVTSPAGLLATAAGAVGATGRPPVPPAKAVGNAVKLATTKAPPAEISNTQRQLAELGIGVAEGRFPWPVA
jgi:hypothetical protein